MDIKAKQAQQPRKKKYIGKPGDMRMADLARQLHDLEVRARISARL
jgi:hypothetical protein